MAKPKSLEFTEEAEANRLLADDPLALMIGMLLDQQVPMEWAFHSPFRLRQRLGRDLDAADIASIDPNEFEALFKQTPALHRFPGSMAKRVQAMCEQIAERFDNDAASIWKEAEDAQDLAKRLGSLPGWGKQKVSIFIALLGKQLSVTPDGWRDVAGRYGEEGSHRSIADVTGPDSLQAVRDTKKAAKAKSE
ncbi:MAG: Fe-S cluster assembly protein HesB [Actinobacteria bacterium]|nr:Fe-S cluster assembly protein HesB [Actinomycetota bacterium]